MEIKQWEYDEFPEFSEDVEGVFRIKTTGEEKGVKYIHDVEYAVVDGTHLRLQILQPFCRNMKARLFPCLVFVQGSAWMKQDVYSQIPLVSKLAERGYVTAIVEYRHSGIAPFPAPVVDTLNAVRFLRKHAETYGIDSEKMILAGDSSGGHTAVFAGIRHNDNTKENLFPDISGEVKGIIDFYGSTSVMRWDSNPSTLNHKLPESSEGMEMGGINLRENLELCRQLSAECNIMSETKIAPLLIFHGTKDRTVSTWSSVDLYKQMKICGKDVNLYLLEGADHGGAEYWTKEVIDIADKFIKKCLR